MKKNRIFQHQYQRQVKMCIYLYQWLVYFRVCIWYTVSLWCRKKWAPKYKYLLKLIKRWSKVLEKNISCEHALNFGQWKTFYKNYKPIRIWLWLVYKFTKNNCCSWLFSKLIQTQKGYPTLLDKISIVTWKLLLISSQNFSCELNSQRTYSLSLQL